MFNFNYHTHSNFCTGNKHPDAYVNYAIEKDFESIGFSSNAPLPFDNHQGLRSKTISEYLSEIEKLRFKNRGKIKIYKSLEIDYIAGISGPQKFRLFNLDYSIGAVHYFYDKLKNEIYSLEESYNTIETIIDKFFNNNTKRFIVNYFNNLQQMIINEPPDMVGHFDLVKKFNKNECLFSNDHNWYQEIVKDTIKSVKKSNVIIEINTRANMESYADEFYPSDWIINKCINEDIPVTISSDAHLPSEIDYKFDNLYYFLKDAGLRKILRYDGNNWQYTKLNGSKI